MEDIEKIKKEINFVSNLKELDIVYRKYLGRKGEVTFALRELGKISEEERKKRAPGLQRLKKEIESEAARRSDELKSVEVEDSLKNEWIDVSAPGERMELGHLHPLTQIQQKVNEIFTSLGFEIVEGPEIETEWYNFDALNIPKDHPAREMWDTFWLRSNQKSEIRNPKSETSTKFKNSKPQRFLLRTHTSPMQVRYMEAHQPPFRIIVPGRVFRHEASDASHDIQFINLEALMVDKDISVANFKAVIGEFFKRLFGENVKIRLRPSFFPFVEPGFEVDMSCTNCNARGCSVCSQTGWLEVMGAGMVHPNVFKSVGYNSGTPRRSRATWQGFAFGVGLDRIAMMKYRIDDIRLFYSGDLRFIKQF